MRRWFAVAVVVFGAATGSVWAVSDKNSVEGLLAQMAEAGRALDYRGTFTYEYGGALKAVRVVHGVKEGREFERLVHLNGTPREIIRRGNAVDCRRIGDVLLRGAAPGIKDKTHQHLAGYYNLFHRGEDRIANRQITVIHLVPRDEFRYGYIVGLDAQTGLLMQLILVGNGERALERFQFTDIEIGGLINDTELSAGQSNHAVAELDGRPCKTGAEDVATESPSAVAWRGNWIPPGFVRAGADVVKTTQSALYTDGLAAFSIFVDSEPPAGVPVVQAQRGATVAHMSRVSFAGRPYNVCVVGEIPKLTAQRIAESVQLGP